jgi:Mg2+ and Co2+ transporter CorA
LNSRRLALIIVGAILLLMGIVFSLQGADVITGSQVMSGNSAYIYIGGVVSVVGIVLLVLAYRQGRQSPQ